MKSTKNLIIIGIVLIIALTATLLLSIKKVSDTREEMSEMVEVMNYEKEMLEEEFSDFNMQFDGYGMNINNDSLINLLDQEKTKVNQLLAELKTTKATNARRISELKKELATVRGVMVHYVQQIDSLDRVNKRLTTENKRVRQRYEAVTQQAEILEKEKNELTQVVTRASMMEVSNFEFSKLNKRGRKTILYSQIAQLKFSFSILKNITVNPGTKSIYLCIVRPDGEVMSKSESNLFSFEDKMILYSSFKQFEYEGEETNETLYWKVEEILQKGEYSAEFFIDGHICGTYTFVIK